VGFEKKAQLRMKKVGLKWTGLLVFCVFLVGLVGGITFDQGALAASRADNPVVQIVKITSPAVVNIDVETMPKR
jgi:hypothetical protein